MREKYCKNSKIAKMAFELVFVYILLAISFYYLTGEQLHFRDSRSNYERPLAEAVSVDLTEGVLIEQEFKVNIQRLEEVTIMWGTYYRDNSGVVNVELWNTTDNTMILSKSIDVSKITEGEVTSLLPENPIETLYGIPLKLKIYGDSQPGCAITPLMSTSAKEEGFTLFFNGEAVDGVLCMSISGKDYIWTGLHYWNIVVCFGIALLILGSIILYRYKKGKHSYVVYAILALKKYHYLIRQLISRDFKTKYKRSVLGVFWSFLNPLLTMIVQYTVFSTIFVNDIQNFASYLIVGIVCFNFFSEATNMALTSIIGNAGLITKVYIPKYIYPLTRVLSSLVNLAISLIPLFLVTIFSGIKPTKAYLLIPFTLMCLTVFCLGVGLLLSSAMVFFRDMQFLWGVLSMIWMYLTPIFYPVDILPENVVWILKINPLYHYITFARTCIIGGISPEPFVYVQCALIALGTLLFGSLVFQKTQDHFVLFL